MRRRLWFLFLPVILLSLAGCRSESDRPSAEGATPPAIEMNSAMDQEPAEASVEPPVSNYDSDDPVRGEASAPSAGGSSGLTKEFLMNQKFVLVQVNGAEYTVGVDQGIPAPTLEFAKDFLVSGRFCNTFRGGGNLDHDILTVETLASTRMLCADQILNQLETRFFQMLGSGAALSMNGDRLFLKQGDNVMVFKAETGLN